ncbi:hypothetical protein C1645_743913 [Glomus cerebriforme]|uniref:Uncharacterized protein n=1 Tax=Glomus cerebriforme TaxID=658196 RepID=A0A397SBM3_9GLOM|nr:hypothetical protein C1645_743913 [Glomus cerebriforme]
MRELVLEDITDTPVIPNPNNSLFIQSPLPPDNSNFEPVPFTLTESKRRTKKTQQKKDKYEKKLNDRKRQQQEATECQLAHKRLKLHIKHLFTYKRPPLISLHNASVGHSKRKDFLQEINDEFTDTLRLHFNFRLDNAFNLAEVQITTFTDWQNNFHAYMTNSPVITFVPRTTRTNRKWMNSTLAAPPTLEVILQ